MWWRRFTPAVLPQTQHQNHRTRMLNWAWGWGRGTAGPGEALFLIPGQCTDSALDLEKRIRPCSCQGGLDPRTGSSFQNSPEQGVQFSHQCSSWLGLRGPSRKEWRQSWLQLPEPGGTLGSRVVVSTAISPEGSGGEGTRKLHPHTEVGCISCSVQLSLSKYISRFFTSRENLSPVGTLNKICLSVESHSLILIFLLKQSKCKRNCSFGYFST